MSAGYASRLSDYPNKGVVGLPETYDSRRTLTLKLHKLAKEMQQSKYTVVLTGAGISTSSGIPDFRGPNGIWTKEKKRQRQRKSNGATPRQSRKRKLPSPSLCSSDQAEKTGNDCNLFVLAKPSLTHRAITKLIMDEKIKYCVTQNVDGLHRRSGLSRDYHSTVHGCVFTEKCSACGIEYFRDQELNGLSFQPTGNFCEECKDGGSLRDILLDWEDPVLDIDRVETECEKADLVLCLGTSLRIEPVGSLPLLAKKFIIVNLQATPKDDMAACIIRAKTDDVMKTVMINLGYDHDWDSETPSPIQRTWKPDNSQNQEWFMLIKECDEKK